MELLFAVGALLLGAAAIGFCIALIPFVLVIMCIWFVFKPIIMAGGFLAGLIFILVLILMIGHIAADYKWEQADEILRLRSENDTLRSSIANPPPPKLSQKELDKREKDRQLKHVEAWLKIVDRIKSEHEHKNRQARRILIDAVEAFTVDVGLSDKSESSNTVIVSWKPQHNVRGRVHVYRSTKAIEKSVEELLKNPIPYELVGVHPFQSAQPQISDTGLRPGREYFYCAIFRAETSQTHAEAHGIPETTVSYKVSDSPTSDAHIILRNTSYCRDSGVIFKSCSLPRRVDYLDREERALKRAKRKAKVKKEKTEFRESQNPAEPPPELSPADIADEIGTAILRKEDQARALEAATEMFEAKVDARTDIDEEAKEALKLRYRADLSAELTDYDFGT